MNEFFSALLTALAPLYFLLVPGVALAWPAGGVVRQATFIIISSLIINILALLTGALLHVPLFIALASLTLLTIVLLIAPRLNFTLPGLWKWLAVAILFLTLYALFSFPFSVLHDGLPTGDSQKAIIWANLIQSENRLPNYQQAVTWLNRDPTDFFTPGLHALVAGLNILSPHPLVSTGLLAIALSLAIALIGGAVATELTRQHPLAVFTLTTIFILTNFRFLRYLREPGYHLQNILGELLLFGLLWLMLRLLRNFRWPDLLLAIAGAIAIVVSHQFTAFLAPFLLLPLCLLVLQKYPRLALVSGSLILISLLVFWLAGLTAKLPHLLSNDPHLLKLTPALADYPSLLSLNLVLAGLAGWIYLLCHRAARGRLGFVAGAFLLLVLSQAPRLGLDIPPVRALFYSIVPLSIGAAFTFTALTRKLSAFTPLRPLTLTALLLAMTVPPVSQAFTLSPGLRTNSTLLPEQLALIDIIGQKQTSSTEAVLIDDYNRRSASWLVLSGQPMFTRLAADIVTHQNEAKQSTLRRALYLNQLDFEKIFSLGSQPEIATLLDKHAIRWLTGIEKSSATAFAHNPVLHPTARGGEVMIFEYVSQNTATNAWLLKPSTLANDIGDEEDEFKHLPLSLRAPNLSEPQAVKHKTFRTTTAPLIPLTANVQDYVATLWDQDKNNQPDGALQLLVRFTTNPGPLAVTTSTGYRATLPPNQLLSIPANAVPFDNGFVILLIENPTRQPLTFDLVALGLAPTP